MCLPRGQTRQVHALRLLSDSIPHSIVHELEIGDYKAKKLLISNTQIKSFCLRYALCEPCDL